MANAAGGLGIAVDFQSSQPSFSRALGGTLTNQVTFGNFAARGATQRIEQQLDQDADALQGAPAFPSLGLSGTTLAIGAAALLILVVLVAAGTR